MGSLRKRLLILTLPLCLVPLVAISTFSYFVARERITEDRVVLFLQQIAAEVADVIRLTLLERKEETVSMTLYSEFRDYLLGRIQDPPVLLLDKLTLVNEVYDVIVLFDADGRLILTNSIDRSSTRRTVGYLNPQELAGLRGQSLLRYTPDARWLQQVRSSRFGYIDWHMSPLVHRLYRYLDNDIASQYCIGFAAPVLDERNVVVGGVLALMNWSFIQEILDKVEEDLGERGLGTGYAFLFASDYDTIIGHKYRRNREYPSLTDREFAVALDNYGTRLVEDHGLGSLREAVQAGRPSFEYEYPKGTRKISGINLLDHEYFGWVVGVGINSEDIFQPVTQLKWILIVATAISISLVTILTFSVAGRIAAPLKRLADGARVIADGDLTQRVPVSGRDEIARLAQSFNEMAASLEERTRQLTDLNRHLEEKVLERTKALEEANRRIQQAYQELKDTQVQLVQSEKMASLGQLVAGVAHEIKNPLNFIYGNTEFLREYVLHLEELVELYERHATLDPEAEHEVERFKNTINYAFLREDLRALIDNFEEGARRIHSIIDDLRTFSRMDSEEFQPADLHRCIDLALNLLQNELRDRIEVRKNYDDLPQILCNPGRLSQVFMNLLLNAAQAISDKGYIEISTRREGNSVTVGIRDNGSGIPREHLDRIFEPFFSTKPVGSGTGLGLSISYSIVRAHKGSIEVESEEGKGTEFRVRLPIRP